MLAEAVQAVNTHSTVIEAAVKALAEKRGSVDKSRKNTDGNDTTENDVNKKRALCSDNEESDPVKAQRLEDDDVNNHGKEKSISPPPSLVRPDFGGVVSSYSTGGTPSKLGLMDKSIEYTFNQSNITMRKSTLGPSSFDLSSVMI